MALAKGYMMESAVLIEGVYFHDLPYFTQADSLKPIPIGNFSSNLRVPGPQYDSQGFQAYIQDITDFMCTAGYTTYQWIYEIMVDEENANVIVPEDDEDVVVPY